MSISKLKNDEMLTGVSDSWDDVFDINCFRNSEEQDTLTALMDIVECKEKNTMDVPISGVEKEDIVVNIADGMMRISSNRWEEKEDEKIIHKEFNCLPSQQSFKLPKDILIDKIDAKYKGGVLHINLPKKETPKMDHHKNIEIK